MRREKGITLVALVITIIVLLILAGITLNLMIGQDGIIIKAQQAGKTQKIAEVKEEIGLAILDAETEARIRKEQLEEEQVKDIISKYGELQEDGDTIKLKEVDVEVSLKDIYNGTTSNTGSYTANKEKIEQLEKQVAELEKALEESSKTEGEKAQELTALKEELAKVTVTEDRILKGYTAYKNDKLITGTMENRGELNWKPTTSTTYTIPAGYYSGGTLDSSDAYNAGKTSLNISTINFTIPTTSKYSSSYTTTISLPQSGLVIGKTCFVVCNSFGSGETGGCMSMQYSINGSTLTITGTVTDRDFYWGNFTVYCIC